MGIGSFWRGDEEDDDGEVVVEEDAGDVDDAFSSLGLVVLLAVEDDPAAGPL